MNFQILHFNGDMMVSEAMAIHPRVRDVFQGYHLGGCSHCAISEFESIKTVAEGYGVPVETLLGALEGLFDMPVPAAPITTEAPTISTPAPVPTLEELK